jgi:hypothetical protein
MLQAILFMQMKTTLGMNVLQWINILLVLAKIIVSIFKDPIDRSKFNEF